MNAPTTPALPRAHRSRRTRDARAAGLVCIGLLAAACASTGGAPDVVATRDAAADDAVVGDVLRVDAMTAADEAAEAESPVDAPEGDEAVEDTSALDERAPDAGEPDEGPAPDDAPSPIDVIDVIDVIDARADARTDARADAPADVARADALVDAPRDGSDGGAVYTVENRTITSGGRERTFVAATPTPMPAMPALVIALHGDGGDGEGMRRSLAIEAASAGAAVVLYPNAPGRTFEYYTYEGRTREAQFVRDVIDDAVTRYGVDRARVFLTGFSGGATMVNALNCRLGATVVRGVGVHSGTLYPTNSTGTPSRPDFGYTSNGGVDCAQGLAPAIFAWGQNDTTSGVRFSDGEGTRDNYLATQACMRATDPFDPSPCVRYRACRRDVVWCAIPGMAHSVWPQAARAFWGFFDGLR